MSVLSPAKHQVITDEFRERISRGELRVGDPLPTQTQLMDRYHVALGTVRQALQQLQHEGLVWSRRGKGTFVAKRTDRDDVSARELATLGLLVISSSAQDPIVFDHIDTLRDAAEARNFDLSIRVIRHGEEERALGWVKSKAGLIVWGAAGFEALEALARQGRPVVLLGESIDGRVPETVGHISWGLEETVRMACDLIFGMGHRRVWLVRRRGTAYYGMVGRLFVGSAQRAGVGAQCDEVLLDTTEDEPRVVERLNAADEAPTALLIEGDNKTCRIVHQIQAAGWPTPGRVSVVAIGAAHEQRITIPGLTRVETPVGAGMSRAADAVAAMVNSSHVIHADVSPRLHIGRTCRPINDSVQS